MLTLWKTSANILKLEKLIILTKQILQMIYIDKYINTNRYTMSLCFDISTTI